MSHESYRTSDRRVIPWLLFGLLVLFAGIYAATYYYTGDRIPRGTSVNGIKVGGMLPKDAEAKLAEGLGGRAAEAITVSAEGKQATLRPPASGFAVDVPATVDRTLREPSWDPRVMWDYFAGGHEVDAVVSVNESSLDEAVAAFAETVDVAPVEGAVTFAGGEARARYPEVGLKVDREAAADEVRSAFLRGEPDDVVELPTEVARATVTKAAVSEAMDTFANPAVSAPVVVRLAGRKVTLQPEEFTPALSMEANGARLTPQIDRARLLAVLGPKLQPATRPPQDATVRIVAGRPRVVPARNGLTFDRDEVAADFLKVLPNTGSARLLAVRSVASPPDMSTADARRLGITERVSGFTTRFPYAAYRNINIGRAAQLLDGTLVKPGETFSLNATIGERTAANGFTKGFIIADGVFREDFGGGVSQVATTTFNAAFFAGLEDVEHKAHSFYIDRYPVGREATVVWPYVDLKFKNTTPYGVLIRSSIEKATPSRQGSMRVTMWSTKYWDIKASQSGRYNTTPFKTRRLSGPECVPNQGYDGFEIDVYRLFYRHGSSKLHHRETMHTTYTPSDTVICS